MQVIQTKPTRTVARLKARLQKAGITQQQVAELAHVRISTVCHVLAGRAVSANIVRSAERLLAGREARG